MNDIQKNILDLQYMKNLQYATTVMIMFFTYGVAVMIAILSGQIVNERLLTATVIVSAGMVSFATLFISFFRKRMQHILEEINQMQ